jgi:hypothetical protein
MAIKDVKSTKDRVNALRNARKLIDSAIRLSQHAQKFYNDESANSNLGSFVLMWDGVRSRIEDAMSATLQASVELGEMADNGFVFQYVWEVGKRGVEKFKFDNGGTVTIVGGTNATQDTAGDVLLTDDLLIIEGTTSNDGLKSVASAATNVIGFSATPTNEDCTTVGARITLIQRGTP